MQSVEGLILDLFSKQYTNEKKVAKKQKEKRRKWKG